jgi:hypothetical protein
MALILAPGGAGFARDGFGHPTSWQRGDANPESYGESGGALEGLGGHLIA